MDQIFSQISSLSWWFSVVLMGVLVSLAGNYLTALVRNLQHRNKQYQFKKEEKKKTLSAGFKQICLESDTMFLYYQKKQNFYAVVFMLLSLLTLTLAISFATCGGFTIIPRFPIADMVFKIVSLLAISFVSSYYYNQSRFFDRIVSEVEHEKILQTVETIRNQEQVRK